MARRARQGAGQINQPSTTPLGVCYSPMRRGRMGSPREDAIAAALAASTDSAASPEVRLKACEMLVRVGVVESALPTLRNLTAIPACAGRARLLLRAGEYFLRRG